VTGRTQQPMDGVEARLLAAASAATWPPAPDLRDGVLARIQVPQPRSRPARRIVLRSLALAVVALIAIAGAAAALGFRLPGLDVIFVPSLPPAGQGFHLGSPIPLADARAKAQPHLLLPSALPDPDVAWEIGAGDRRILTVAWRAGSGQPTLEDSGLSLLLMAVPGRADRDYLTKALPPGTRIESVSVGGDQGWWISGDVHELMFPRTPGEVGILPARLVGDALVFSRDGTLYRLESALGKDATVAISDTLR
jgi:hypothetical protein